MFHTPDNWITWSHAKEKLANEKIYWIATASAEGKPHSVPLWAIWLDNNLFFETSKNSVKARNLEENPRIVFHVQDGNDTVIAEGRVRKENRSHLLEQLRRDYETKYQYKPNWRKEGSDVVYRIEPKIIHAWKNPHMHQSAVRFVF